MLRNVSAEWLTAQWNEELAISLEGETKKYKERLIKARFWPATELKWVSLLIKRERERERHCILSLPTWVIFTLSLWVKATPFSLPPTHSPPLSLHPSIHPSSTHTFSWALTSDGDEGLQFITHTHFLWPPPPKHISLLISLFISHSAVPDDDVWLRCLPLQELLIFIDNLWFNPSKKSKISQPDKNNKCICHCSSIDSSETLQGVLVSSPSSLVKTNSFIANLQPLKGILGTLYNKTSYVNLKG